MSHDYCCSRYNRITIENFIYHLIYLKIIKLLSNIPLGVSTVDYICPMDVKLQCACRFVVES